MAQMIVRTPTTTWDAKKGVVLNDVIKKQVETQTAEILIPKIAKIADNELDKQLSIIATFFQRVVARTPIDEPYKRSEKMIKNKKTGQMEPDEHIPDKSVCQEDWYITDGKTKITAKDMKRVDDRMFWNISDKYMVNQIKKILQEKFTNISSNTVFTIGNNNDHFKTLEEGCDKWLHDRVVAKGEYREHGVKNKRSVQAPVGMWRISLAELEIMKNSKAASSLTSRYRAQGWRTLNRTPSKSQMKKFVDYLEKETEIKYDDIKAYLGKYKR